SVPQVQKRWSCAFTAEAIPLALLLVVSCFRHAKLAPSPLSLSPHPLFADPSTPSPPNAASPMPTEALTVDDPLRPVMVRRYPPRFRRTKGYGVSPVRIRLSLCLTCTKVRKCACNALP
ncbi:MAG: hypothetical protein BJ554DRAFT_5375, partial [Olpidium bornovanus]